jgi:hypothetical protein
MEVQRMDHKKYSQLLNIIQNQMNISNQQVIEEMNHFNQAMNLMIKKVDG